MCQEGSFPVAGDGLPSDIYVGRQAIFDSRRRVMGYELLYRRGTDNWATIDDPVAATSAVVSAAILGFGLDHLVSDVDRLDRLLQRRHLAELHLGHHAHRRL